jgi:hypothetical protein
MAVIFDPPEQSPLLVTLPRDPADRAIVTVAVSETCAACGGRLEQRCANRACRYG